MTKSENGTTPVWTLVLAGILLGQSGLATSTIDTCTRFVQAVLVPLYGLCAFGYLARLVWEWHQALEETKLRESRLRASQVMPVGVEESTGADSEDGVLNMTGSYQLVKNDNFEGFLEVQGVPWALRRAANQARPIHKITHVGKSVTIQIKGIIESQTTYIVDGPPVQTSIRGRIFQDAMKYLESGDGIQVSKKAVTENYDITVTRRLNSDKSKITMVSRASFNDGRDPVESFQEFVRLQ